VWDRCVTRGMPGSMFPTVYNNFYQIVQTPGYVVILYEMIHEARIIPLEWRSHIGAHIRQWNGDARGRWEGNTLVVDTTNFNDRGQIATHAAAGRLRGIVQSEALHVIERFTRVDADTIDWEATIEDPNVYYRPWKISIPLERRSDAQIFQYECHEGNSDVKSILLGARLAELEAAARNKSK
jgi:hypothetical protein